MKLPFNLLVLNVFHAEKNRVRPEMALIGLSPGQPKLLTFLGLNGECLQKDLAAACDIEAATISKLLNSLEENGLIRRDTHSGDRRATRIALTEAGSWLYETEIRPRIGAINQCSLSGFTPEEAELFQRFLKRMYRNLTGMSLE